MGTYYQWVADLDATDEEADALGQRVVDDLVRRGVVLPGLSSEAALGGQGHPVGPAWPETVEHPVPGGVSGEPPWGLEVRLGREVHDGAQYSVEAVTCPRCSVRRPFYGPPDELGPTGTDEAGLRAFYEAAATWRDGGEADLACAACGTTAPVTRWQAEGAALASLVFVFWEWDELRPEVLRWIADATGGHRIVDGPGKV